MKSDWAAHDYFKAGIDIADALTITIGPIQETAPVLNAFDPMAVPDFIAGFIYGMTGDNDLVEIEACF